MICVDASLLVDALVGDGDRGDAARSALRADPAWCAPDFAPAEVFSAVRGLHRGGRVTTRRAEASLDALRRLEIDYVRARDLIPTMWRLRDAVGAYDSGYVAAAMMRRCTLVTADERLARGAASWCEVRTPFDR